MSNVTFGVYFFYMPVKYPSILPYLLIVPIAVGYALATRYFMVRRVGTPFRTQLLVYLAMPVLALYGFFVLRALRCFAMCTCLKTGWGTRQQVESLTVATPKAGLHTSTP
jgi:hyaluronan synthase